MYFIERYENKLKVKLNYRTYNDYYINIIVIILGQNILAGNTQEKERFDRAELAQESLMVSPPHIFNRKLIITEHIIMINYNIADLKFEVPWIHSYIDEVDYCELPTKGINLKTGF